eukprot:m.131283 g.131283  ORF g.131283 m.131283 type:complete len:1126 (-) comp13072_c0_seq1:164-3541(-)
MSSTTLLYPCCEEDYEIEATSSWDAYSATRYCRGYVIETGELVNIRCLNVEVLTSTDARLEEEQHGISLSMSFEHPNIYKPHVHFITTTFSPPELWSVGPYTPQGSVRDLMDTTYPSGCDELLTVTILKSVLEGLHYLHSNGYVHNKVKSDSIVISHDLNICLHGLKFAKNIEEDGFGSKLFHHCLDHTIIPWLAPEVLAQDSTGYDYSADIYSVGVLTYELLCGESPFEGLDPAQMLLYKFQGVQISLEPRKRLSRKIHSFVEACMRKNPLERPSAKDLLGHSVFKQVKKPAGTLQKYLPRHKHPFIAIPEESYHVGLSVEEPPLPSSFFRHPFSQLYSGGLAVFTGPSRDDVHFHGRASVVQHSDAPSLPLENVFVQRPRSYSIDDKAAPPPLMMEKRRSQSSMDNSSDLTSYMKTQGFSPLSLKQGSHHHSLNEVHAPRGMPRHSVGAIKRKKSPLSHSHQPRRHSSVLTRVCSLPIAGPMSGVEGDDEESDAEIQNRKGARHDGQAHSHIGRRVSIETMRHRRTSSWQHHHGINFADDDADAAELLLKRKQLLKGNGTSTPNLFGRRANPVIDVETDDGSSTNEGNEEEEGERQRVADEGNRMEEEMKEEDEAAVVKQVFAMYEGSTLFHVPETKPTTQSSGDVNANHHDDDSCSSGNDNERHESSSSPQDCTTPLAEEKSTTLLVRRVQSSISTNSEEMTPTPYDFMNGGISWMPNFSSSDVPGGEESKVKGDWHNDEDGGNDNDPINLNDNKTDGSGDDVDDEGDDGDDEDDGDADDADVEEEEEEELERNDDSGNRLSVEQVMTTESEEDVGELEAFQKDIRHHHHHLPMRGRYSAHSEGSEPDLPLSMIHKAMQSVSKMSSTPSLDYNSDGSMVVYSDIDNDPYYMRGDSASPLRTEKEEVHPRTGKRIAPQLEGWVSGSEEEDEDDDNDVKLHGPGEDSSMEAGSFFFSSFSNTIGRLAVYDIGSDRRGSAVSSNFSFDFSVSDDEGNDKQSDFVASDDATHDTSIPYQKKKGKLLRHRGVTDQQDLTMSPLQRPRRGAQPKGRRRSSLERGMRFDEDGAMDPLWVNAKAKRVAKSSVPENTLLFEEVEEEAEEVEEEEERTIRILLLKWRRKKKK